jgi:DNA-binding transcriptional regulator LsrR (DeoR family)
MRKIKDVLRLHFKLNLKRRQIGSSLNLPHSTVGDYIGRADHAESPCPCPKG